MKNKQLKKAIKKINKGNIMIAEGLSILALINPQVSDIGTSTPIEDDEENNA